MRGAVIVSVLLSLTQVAFAEVICKTQVIRGQDYTESVFYDGSKVVARVKQSKNGVEVEGDIPDGAVKFTDAYHHSYGEESYRGGKKNGISRTYFAEGALKKESYYLNGQLLVEKEYYLSGALRFEVDYNDARDIPGNSEVGVGKIYYPNGKLKYEWRFVRSDAVAYKKTYTREGQLRHADYFDEKNKWVKSEDPLLPDGDNSN